MASRGRLKVLFVALLVLATMIQGCSSEGVERKAVSAQDSYGSTGTFYAPVPTAEAQGEDGRVLNDFDSAPNDDRSGLAYDSRRPQPPSGRDIIDRLSPSEELWVIERRPDGGRPDDAPGCGSLLALRGDGTERVPVPLEHTDVRASVSGYIATVDVKQRFTNPFSEKIEAVYVFPLPHDAAVSEFVMTIGDRRIRGVIRDRQEAEEIYYEARARGHVASLLRQDRPNIFTQRVANIEPGRRIDIDLRYFNTLRFEGGAFEFVFPMVVGPRYNPDGSRDGVGAVARGGRSGQPTDVSYLAPHERSGHDVSVSMEVDAGVAVERVESPSHAVRVERRSPSRFAVKLSESDRVPNKDFVLRYGVSGKQPKAALLTRRDERGGFFTLMLVPPSDLEALPRRPVEMIFVVDCSGSMSGVPLDIAKAAMTRALKRLEPDDSFQIIRFSSTASKLGSRPLIATRRNVDRGLTYLRRLSSGGGTEMIEGIKASLDFPHDPERQRIVSFVTDGYIGNEAEIFAAIEQRLDGARIFSFGVGSSVNRYLLAGMARLGRGAVAYVGVDEGAARAVDLFYERARRPALTELAIDWGGADVRSVFPKRCPDLFVGRPVVLSGRFDGAAPSRIRVTGRAGHERREMTLVADSGAGEGHVGIPQVWARHLITDLEYTATFIADRELPEQIRDVALRFGLVSSQTSFVAVDAGRRTAGRSGTTVPVPVPVPDGVRYETSVEKR